MQFGGLKKTATLTNDTITVDLYEIDEMYWVIGKSHEPKRARMSISSRWRAVNRAKS